MKKFGHSIIAGLLAIMLFAFTATKRTPVCTTSAKIIWFVVKINMNLPCASLAAVDPLRLILHDKITSDALSDMEDQGFYLTQEEAIQSTTVGACPNIGNKTCAVGYTANASDFELDPTGNFWQPKTGVEPVCDICRTEA